jgi:hypothetical protein
MTNWLTTDSGCYCPSKGRWARPEPFDDWIASIVAICAVAALAIGIQNLLVSVEPSDREATVHKTIVVERPLPLQARDGKF